MYIPRLLAEPILEAQPYFPVTVVSGPRRSGKTELCKHLFAHYKYVNLEDLETRQMAQESPNLFFDMLGDQAIIDEVQNVPQLMSLIQVRVDEDKKRRYILTGSANFTLLKGITQSLAGRAAIFTLLPFSFKELKKGKIAREPIEELEWKGLYPAVVADNTPVDLFYRNYINTYIERDVRAILNIKNLLKFQTFLKLTAARCGSEFNAAAVSKDVGVSATTISEWLSILYASYIIYNISPYYGNINKRLTKMPKIYFYDTGLLAFLLGIENPGMIENSPFRGMLFENLAMGELIKSRYNAGKNPDLYFYREYSGKEVDVMLRNGAGYQLYEIKASSEFKSEFLKNLKYVENLVPDIKGSTVIYDGKTLGTGLINIREI